MKDSLETFKTRLGLDPDGKVSAYITYLLEQ
jgi:hypothetical protein